MLVHKVCAAVALGTAFAKANLPPKFVCLLLTIFAVLCPIGIFFGMFLLEETNDLVLVIFTSLSAGTFAYVAGQEILAKEFKNKKNLCLKIFMMIFGSFIIIVLWALGRLTRLSQ